MGQAGPYVEVEAKLLVDDLAAVEARLVALGAARRHDRVYERNIRYEDAAGTLTPDGVVLRLRQDSRARLTYKGPAAQDTPGLQSRYEAEVTVDDFETMDLILRQLGFRPFMVYEKYRTTYALVDTEIVLDEMPYGQFVEVEGRSEAIEAALDSLGLAGGRRLEQSYGQLFDFVRVHLGLTFTDLTFENFEGVSVPAEAFSPPEG